jgi:hypothetical protein
VRLRREHLACAVVLLLFEDAFDAPGDRRVGGEDATASNQRAVRYPSMIAASRVVPFDDNSSSTAVR